MQLIDAQALYSDIDALGGCDAKEEWAQGYDCGIAAALDALEKAPTIDAEPVQHGRWIEKPPYADETVKELEFQIVCSRCDEQNASINFNDDGEIIGKTFYKTKFCPNCGAKMDGGEKNERKKV